MVRSKVWLPVLSHQWHVLTATQEEFIHAVSAVTQAVIRPKVTVDAPLHLSPLQQYTQASVLPTVAQASGQLEPGKHVRTRPVNSPSTRVKVLVHWPSHVVVGWELDALKGSMQDSPIDPP